MKTIEALIAAVEKDISKAKAWQRLMEEIQLDAWKQGMTHAINTLVNSRQSDVRMPSGRKRQGEIL